MGIHTSRVGAHKKSTEIGAFINAHDIGAGEKKDYFVNNMQKKETENGFRL